MCEHTWQNNFVFTQKRNSKPITCYNMWEAGGFIYDFKQESIFILLIFAQLLPDVLHLYTIKAKQVKGFNTHTHPNQNPPPQQESNHLPNAWLLATFPLMFPWKQYQLE